MMTGTYLGLLGCGFLTGAAVRMVRSDGGQLSMLESGVVAFAVVVVGAWLLKREERQRAADRAAFEKAIDKVSGDLVDKLSDVASEIKSGREAAIRDFENKLDRIEDVVRQGSVEQRGRPPASGGGAA